MSFVKRASLLSRTSVITMFINMLKPNNMLFLSKEKHGSHGDTCGSFYSTKFSRETSPMISRISIASLGERARKNKLSSGRWLSAGINKTEPTTTY
jgi:hypothetical protein